VKYLSVCSGIEAATVAWHSLGWKPEAFSEIEKFPSQVLAHHYPTVPNLGDMTKFKEWNIGAIDLLVGGTPCQSFSVAGLRKGLDDPRGNLMLTYLAIAEQFKPKWLVWENVPGVLSSNGGKDFGSLLGGLAELGYGFAYRILDAQYFGVPQRRRRVFVVGCLGDWRAAAAVLFERDSLCWNPAPKREAGKDIAGTISKCSFDGGAGGRPEGAAAGHFQVVAQVSSVSSFGGYENNIGTLRSHGGDLGGGSEMLVSYGIQTNSIGRQDHNGGNGIGVSEGIAPTLTKADQHGLAIVLPFDTTQITSQTNRSNPKYGDPCHTLNSGAHAPSIALSFSPQATASQGCRISDVVATLDKSKVQGIMQHSQVRRLTPKECERLQGFPDDYTLIPVGKKMAADGPRYKALGNSMAVPVMHWIGSRIKQVEEILNAK